MADLIVARHGQTDWNLKGRFQGHADPPLNASGLAQADQLAAEVADLGITLVLTSDLDRARRTAAAVAGRLGLDVAVDAGFREIDLAAWEGLHAADALARFPEEYRAWTAGEDVARGGGETAAVAAERFIATLDRHLAGATGPAIVVAHGLVLEATMNTLASAARITLEGTAPHLGNGGWIRLDVRPVPDPRM